MKETNRIYFDNAATSFPKPREVINEVIRCMKYYCGNPGRGAHSMSLAATEKIFECREEASNLFNAGGAENVAFACNTTYALNNAIKCALRPGDKILISNAEHNSVRRPVASLRSRGVEYDIYNAFSGDDALLYDLLRKIDRKTKAVVAVHHSNICPLVLPIEKIGRICREKGLYFIVDAAQSAGCDEIDMVKCCIDALCVPGHKGLYGPQGCGMMIVSERFKELLSRNSTLIEGGSGINSLEEGMPIVFPERFEAGTLNTPAIAGLCEGIKFVARTGIPAIADAENRLYRRAKNMLLNTKNVRLYMPKAEQGSILLFTIDGMSSGETAAEFDSRGICMRAGLHCAPLAHKALGTDEDGAVRLSFGAFNTHEEVEYFGSALSAIANKRK